MESKLITPEQASEMLGIKLATLYTWSLQGRIPSYKINGKLRRFDLHELQEWVKAQKAGRLS